MPHKRYNRWRETATWWLIIEWIIFPHLWSDLIDFRTNSGWLRVLRSGKDKLNSVKTSPGLITFIWLTFMVRLGRAIESGQAGQRGANSLWSQIHLWPDFFRAKWISIYRRRDLKSGKLHAPPNDRTTIKYLPFHRVGKSGAGKKYYKDKSVGIFRADSTRLSCLWSLTNFG